MQEGDLEQRNEVGETPLLQAAADGHLAHVKLLLQAGANSRARDSSKEGIEGTQHHRSALLLSAKCGYVECVRALLGVAADDVDEADGDGITPLMWAALNGHTEVVRELLGLNANVAARDTFGSTALWKVDFPCSSPPILREDG